jgi:hypothetical protein
MKNEISETGEMQRPSVKTWFEEQMKSGTITVEKKPLGATSGWGPYTNKQGQIEAFGSVDSEGNPTKKYFMIEGFLITNAGREVQSWGQVGVEEVKDPSDPDGAIGTVGLLVDKNSGELLLQAVAEPFVDEPGKSAENYVNLRASIQGSYTNINEHKVPNSEYIDTRDYRHLISINPSRILGKIRYGISVVDKKNIKTGSNAKWFTPSEVDQAVLAGVPMNGVLHTALNIYKAQKAEGLLPLQK